MEQHAPISATPSRAPDAAHVCTALHGGAPGAGAGGQSGWRARAFSAVALVMLAGCATVAPLEGDSEITLHVRVDGVEPGLGSVYCAVYQNPSTFLTKEGIAEGKSEPATHERATFEFRVPAGRALVVSVFQDINANGQLDRGTFGIPNEPWGFSGSPAAFGPPTWNACAIVPGVGCHCIEIVLKGRARGRGGRPTP